MNKKQQLTELINKEVKKIITEVKNTKKVKAKKKVKKPTMEGLTVESHGGVEKNDLGTFYIVINPTKGSTDENLVLETDLFNFTEKIQNGSLAFENVRAIVSRQDRANRIKERILRERVSAITDAKKKAEKFKGLKDEVHTKIGNLKTMKSETQAAVGKLK